MSLAMSRKERETFLADLHVGIVSIPDGDQGPLACPVWYSYEPGEDVLLVTGENSRKGTLLRSAKRVSLVVQSEEVPYKYVSIEGPVELGDADLERDVRPIAHRYLGAEVGDGYIEATRESGAGRDILVRIRPERWLTVDYSKQFQVPSSESAT